MLAAAAAAVADVTLEGWPRVIVATFPVLALASLLDKGAWADLDRTTAVVASAFVDCGALRHRISSPRPRIRSL